MTTAAIQTQGLGKRYRLRSGTPSGSRMLREDLVGWGKRALGGGPGGSTSRDVWALRNLDLEVEQGEVLGLIGHNGAGKSTLLRLLSRITAPSEGRARVRGRVGTLLEVGTGFHLELTGRENVFLSGAVLGLARTEVSQQLPDIEEMANVGEYLDVPVKRYSTGMFVRLAFAVASCLRTEILLVDEILAVGDAEFRRRCLGSIDQAARDGRSVIFVSHNTAAVEQVCTRAAYLAQGQLAYLGTPEQAVERYYGDRARAPGQLAERTDREGSGAARVTTIELLDGEGRPLEVAAAGAPLMLRLRYGCPAAPPTGRVRVHLQVCNHFNQPLFVHDNELSGDRIEGLAEQGALLCSLPRLPLAPSSYRLSYRLMAEGHTLDAMGDAMELRVASGDFHPSGLLPDARDGACLVDASWRVDE